MALLKFKRSATPSKVPTTSDLSLGELAMNTFDGKLYMKKDDGTEAIVEIGGGATGGTVTSVAASGGATGLTFSGSPITSSGTLTLGGTLALASGGTGATTAATARVNLGAAASGANADITSMTGLTGGISTPDYIDFDTAATPARATGRLWWDNADGISTLNLGMAGSDVTLQVGQETHFRIKASSAITNGQVVMLTGTVGASGALTGAPASGITADTGSYIMGVATESIALNGWGYITQFGLVRGIDTSGGTEAWTDGQILYYDPSVAGGLTKNVPTAPNAKVEVAAVVYAHATNGSLFVRVAANPSLEQLSDVETAAASNTDLLQYNGTAGKWEHKSPTLITVGNVSGVVAVANGGTGATTAAGALTNLGAYAASNPAGYTTNTGTVTSVAASAGTGISVTGSPITTSGTLTITNTAPDQTVTLTQGGTTTITGTYPNFTISSADQYSGTVTSVGGTGSVNGLTLSGTVASSGNLTLGGTLAISNADWSGTDLSVANGGTGASTAAGALANLGAQAAATALTTTTSFGGDVSGTYNAIVVADDSHNHIISNVDGLQTALDAKQNSSTALTTTTSFGGDVSGTYNAITLDATLTPLRATELSSSVNLDTLVGANAGFYYQASNADTTGNNYPSGEAGSLIVQRSAGNATQLYQTYSSSSPKMFFRANYTTGYGSWQRVFADDYHPNADKWTTARTLSLTGDVTGSVSWDGSGNASLSATVVDDSHNHIYDNIDGLTTNAWGGPRITTASGYIDFGPANTSWAHIYTDRPAFYFNVDTSADDVYGRSSVRAPIFYDSDNTAYYTNPESSTRLNGWLSFGVAGGGANTSGRWISIEGNAATDGEASGRVFFTEHNSTTAAMDNYGMSLAYRGGSTSIVGASGNTWTGLTQIANGEWGMFGHNNNATGAVIMSGFRDGAYVKIHGANGLYVGEIRRLNGVAAIDLDSATYTQFRDPTGSVKQWIGNNDTSYYNNNVHYFRNSASGVTMSIDTSGNVVATGSHRAPIFYDSNNTAYYTDPASTSVLNALTVGGSSVLTASTTFGGDVSGTYNAIVVADDSHNHIISNVDGLQTALDAKANLNSPSFTGAPLTGGFEIGYRKVPLSSVTTVTADASIVGRGYLATSTVTVPANVFSAGDIFSVINNSAANISISQGTGLTMRLVGTATTGSRTLAQRGIATIMFVSATECIVTGVT